MAVMQKGHEQRRSTASRDAQRRNILSKIPGDSCAPRGGIDIIRLLHSPGVPKDSPAAPAEDGAKSSSHKTVPYLQWQAEAFAEKQTPEDRTRVKIAIQCMLQMATAWAIAPLAQISIKPYDMSPKEMLEHALAVHVAVANMDAALGLNLPGYVFVAALFHDIGKVVLSSFAEVDVAQVIALASQAGVSLESAERKILGIDHAEAGAILLENWGLPKDIVDLVRRHHLPDSAPRDQEAFDALHAADALCMTAIGGRRNANCNYYPSLSVTKRLGLSTEEGQRAVLKTLNELERTASLFEEA